MTSKLSLRRALMVGVAGFALAACSDTDISSPGVAAPAPAPAPAPTTPVGADISTDLSSFDDSHPNLTVTEFTTTNGSTVDVVEIAGTVTDEDLTLQAGIPYKLSGTVVIGNDAGITTTTADPDGTNVLLTIPAGTTIYGEGPNDGLVIARGSRIEAVGTATNPIVFTSVAELERQNGLAPANPNARGEWGGLIINGFAPINDCDEDTATGGTADCEKEGEANSGLFGGDDPMDDSGELRYVRIEFGGAVFNGDNEANGLALQGVGSETDINFIHVHNNLDDAIEFFGGTVSANYFVATGTSDDAIDWTDGWTGSMQFAAVDAGEGLRDDAYGIEGDNLDGANDALPRSNPVISNFTFVGNDEMVTGVRVRRGSAGELLNGIVSGYPTGLDIDSDATFERFDGTGAAGDEVLNIESHLFNNTVEIADDGDILTVSEIAAELVNVATGSPLASGSFVPGAALGAVPVADLPTGETRLPETPTFIGAFSPSETVDDNWALSEDRGGWTRSDTLFDAASVSCPTGTIQDGAIGDQIVCNLQGEITEDLTLSNGANILYRLNGTVLVGRDSGPTSTATAGSFEVDLTIDPGVTVFGDGTADSLVVTRGSRIFSNGEAGAPVVFTAGSVLRGEVAAADLPTLRGEWGGLILNGKAPINDCDEATATGGTADCEKEGEANSGLFGGDVSDDDSGSISYTRIEYGGVVLNGDNEANGIAFQGVGNETDVSFVQVHNNLDDGLEFFGGTVNAKYVIVTGQADDGIDWTDGWTGNIQYAIVESVGDPGRDDAYGFEGDNLDGGSDDLPRSNPNISNFTIVGDPFWVAGARWRRGTAGNFINGIIINNDFGVDIDSTATYDNFDNAGSGAGDEILELASLFLDNTEELRDDGDIPASFIDDHFDADNNIITDGTTTLGGFSFFEGETGAIGIVPQGLAESNVTVTDASTLSSSSFTFDSTDYIGAVEDDSDTWFAGWTIDVNGALTSAN